MEAGASARFSNALQSYGNNIASLKSALNEGVDIRSNTRLQNIAKEKAQSLQTAFVNNLVSDEKQRAVDEALGSLGIQLGLAYPVVKKLNEKGAFEPAKRAGKRLLEKLKSNPTSRVSEVKQIPKSLKQLDTKLPAQDVRNTELRSLKNIKPSGPQETELTDLNKPVNNIVKQSRSTLTRTVRQAGKFGEQMKTQPGRVGQDFETDPEQMGPKLSEKALGKRPISSLDEGAKTVKNLGRSAKEIAKKGASSAEDAARGLATRTSTTAATEAGESAVAGASEGAAEAGAVAAGETVAAGAAEATILGTASAALGPLSVLAGLGFAGYELFEAFKHHDHPKPPPQQAALKISQKVQPKHRTLMVAPSANAQLLQASSSSSV